MSPLHKLVSLSIALLLTSCTTTTQIRKGPVDARLNPTVIASFGTYRWGDSPFSSVAPGERVDSQYTSTIREEVDRTLGRKGFRQDATSNADMTVAVLVTINESQGYAPQDNPTNAPEYPPTYGFRWNLNKAETPVRMEQLTDLEQVNYYEKGTLHLGFFDSDKQLFWHGTASKVIHSGHSTQTHQQVLRHAIEELLSKFPDHTVHK